MKTKIFGIIITTAMILAWSIAGTYLFHQVKSYGLKNIVQEIWEGEK